MLRRPRRDDSNRFVVSVNMFNRTSPSAWWIVIIALGLVAAYAAMVYNLWRKAVT